MKSKERWIEIQFAYLCFDIYNSLKDYILTTNYIEFLADIANIEKQVALRLLQKVNQINKIRPNNAEYICVARQNKQTISQIITVLDISKSTYINIMHNTDMNVEHYAVCTSEEVQHMKELLHAHQILKETGI